MKKLCLSLLFLFICLPIFANTTLVISTGEWPPYTSEKDPNARVIQTIVEEAFKLEDIDVVYRYFPWKRALKTAKELGVDGSLPWSKSTQREKVFYYSKQPIIKTKTVFFYLKSLDFKWEKFDDLKQYRIGSSIGYKVSNILIEKKLNVELVPKEEQNFKKLLAGRIDITPSSFFVGYYIINKLFPRDKAFAFTNDTKKVLPQSGVHFILSKKHPKAKEIIQKFDRGFEKLIQLGRYKKIVTESISK